MQLPPYRARSPWSGMRVGVDASREPVRQSLTRYYKSRTDPTRTRGARRAAKARKLAHQLKHHPAPIEL